MPTITTNAADLIKQFTRLEQFKHLKASLKAAATHVKGKIAKYPDAGNKPRKGWMSENVWTDKQRRWFWANLKEGNISLPYQRGTSPGSEALGRKWTTAPRNNGMAYVVGNNVSYGPLVQGEKQARYHAQTGWKTTEQVAAEEAQTVTDYIIDGINRDLEAV